MEKLDINKLTIESYYLLENQWNEFANKDKREILMPVIWEISKMNRNIKDRTNDLVNASILLMSYAGYKGLQIKQKQVSYRKSYECEYDHYRSIEIKSDKVHVFYIIRCIQDIFYGSDYKRNIGEALGAIHALATKYGIDLNKEVDNYLRKNDFVNNF